MITVKEIAKMCDVSPSTVSNILNGKPNVSEKTRQRVWQAVKETGYQPNYYAANMRKQSTRTIAIIAEDLGQFSTTPILEAAMATCEEREYRTVIMNLRLYDKWRDTWYNDEPKLQSVLSPVLNELKSIKVDGVLYIAGHGRLIRCIPEDFSIPTVVAYASRIRYQVHHSEVSKRKSSCRIPGRPSCERARGCRVRISRREFNDSNP